MLLFAILIFVTPITHAVQGVGVVYSTVYETVQEGEQKCISYGLFNEFDEDVTAELRVSGGLTSILKGVQTSQVFLKAGTGKEQAIQTPVCFKVDNVYSEQCIAGMLCKQTCSEDPVTYKGQVEVVKTADPTAGGSGSGMALSIPADLTVQVKCNPHGRSYGAFVVTVAVVIIVLIGIHLLIRKRSQA